MTIITVYYWQPFQSHIYCNSVISHIRHGFPPHLVGKENPIQQQVSQINTVQTILQYICAKYNTRHLVLRQ